MSLGGIEAGGVNRTAPAFHRQTLYQDKLSGLCGPADGRDAATQGEEQSVQATKTLGEKRSQPISKEQ